jgi:thiamine biosynthesis lipoprotein
MRKKDPQVAIDLSSVGQGYTVGVIANYLEAQGIVNYLVEIGGEMKVRGRKPDGSLWRVAVERPDPNTRQVEEVVELVQDQGMAIMTAGTYRHFFEEGGKTYSHILDPRTGQPVTHQLRSVTILHEDPTWADVWDTALLCVGEREAQRIVEQEGLMALLIWGEKDQFEAYQSSSLSHSNGIRLSAPQAKH